MKKPVGYTAGTSTRRCSSSTAARTGRTTHTFDFQREFFAANGYVVLAVNYRGSSGRGEVYQKAIFADWGQRKSPTCWRRWTGRRERLADPDRLGIGGWSYGGILTDYTIATDTRFKAAMSGASSALQSRSTARTSTSSSTTTRSARRGRAEDL